MCTAASVTLPVKHHRHRIVIVVFVVGKVNFSEPEARGSIPHLGSRRLSLISIDHPELLSIVLPRWC